MASDTSICIDTDALVNLLALAAFDDALACIGCSYPRCYRLPAAGSQVRNSAWLGKRWAKADRVAMSAITESLPVIPVSSNLAVQEALNCPGIDAGEVLILAAAYEDPRLLVMSGDGRMLRALYASRDPTVCQVREALHGRFIVFPQIIAALCRDQHSLARIEDQWRAAASPSTNDRHRSLCVMFGTPPTRLEEFQQGYQHQLGNVTIPCGGDGLLYPLF